MMSNENYISIVIIEHQLNNSNNSIYGGMKLKESLFSNHKAIKVNNVGKYHYSILFDSDEFTALNQLTLADNIYKILTKNLPGSRIKFHIDYRHISDDGKDFLSNESMTSIHLLIDTLQAIGEISAEDLTANYTAEITTPNPTFDFASFLDNDTDDDDDNEDEDDDDSDDEDDDLSSAFDKIMKSDYTSKKKHKNYDSSYVIEDAKDPKKAYHRHGVIVCSKKSSIRKDEKTIRKFLKNFFPGDNKWVKDFRDDVLNRWMSMYMITGDKLKKMERKHRKDKSKKHKSDNAAKTLDFTRRLFNTPLVRDRWDDPSK